MIFEDEFTEKEINLLHILLGHGILRIYEKQTFKHKLVDYEDAGRHFIIMTQNQVRGE